ncbi:response regulator [Nitrosopumilus sp.]|uniref:response regulator n=1 Tax=Nitrosopumilus sp. TaxID=2024843 RepID=UPI002601D19F|nr:response regulator [Nitrosopumilus sp.]
MKILIVEDEIDLLEEYKIFLEKNNHNVLMESDGEAGLKTYFENIEKNSESSSFDIVILDYQLPGKNGLEIASEILEKYPKQRILFASAYVEDTLRESIKTLKQVVELLQKPFSLQSLLSVIEDTSVYEELEKLNVDIKNLKDIEPTHAQITTYLELMKKLQKN